MLLQTLIVLFCLALGCTFGAGFALAPPPDVWLPRRSVAFCGGSAIAALILAACCGVAALSR